MLQHDSIFFIGVFVFIFILWLVLGGPARPLSFGGPVLPGPDALGGGTYLSFPRAANIGTSGVGSSRASGSTSGGLTKSDERAIEEAIASAAFGVPSSYRGEVTITRRITNAGNANPQNEYLQISLSSRADRPVTISGWSLQSQVTGKGGTIPQGTEVPRSGIINAAEPIVLQPGDRAYIFSGRSPIGASFRENACIGYFGQFQKFTPALPNSCPTPYQELEDHYGPDLVRDPLCLDYFDSLARCTLPLSPPATLTSACQQVVTTYLNYNGCLVTHERDSNFKRAVWRIYLGRDVSIWRTTREVVKVFDASGKTVDMFSY